MPEEEIRRAQGTPEKERNSVVDDHEHVVDIEAPEIKERIREARELFDSFFERYKEEFDLSDPEKIEDVIQAAEKEGIFAKAREIRELIFDKNISLYGVCYLSNRCDQNCRFCPMGQLNYEEFQNWLRLVDVQQKLKESAGEDPDNLKRTEEDLRRSIDEAERKFKTISANEASNDIDAIARVGHQEICILSGEEISLDPSKVVEYAQIALDTPGIKEVILNMGSYSEEIFRWIKENLRIPDGVKLQHRVFQETYDRGEYDYYMERSGAKGAQSGKISKRDFDFRYNSQVNALRAGFDEVGIGVLFGLSKYPLAEIAGLQQHADYIREQAGREPKRCCLPVANQPAGGPQVEIKHMIVGMENEQRITELIYALARLAMPTISIVNSERDTPETLKILDQYANHSTLFVHPAPGENIDSIQQLGDVMQIEEGTKPVGQAEVYPRKPADALKDWKQRGYNILGFDVGKYPV